MGRKPLGMGNQFQEAGMTLADLLMLFGACVAVAFFLIAGAVWWLSRIARREFSDSELRAAVEREGRD